MTALVWDTPGERIFQTGVDRGVLYLSSGTAVVWNGLTGVQESSNGELKSFYLNGLKYLEYISPGDFSATLTAYTFPKEFESLIGIVEIEPGFNVYEQPSKSFRLSYPTKIGDDIQAVDLAYLIHILYNVRANPQSVEYPTIGENIEAMEFSWDLSSKPSTDSTMTWRPSAHFTVDSREVGSEMLSELETVLYGDESTVPSLPSVDTIRSILSV